MYKREVIAVSVVVGLCAVTIMALVTRFFVAKAKHSATDNKHVVDGKAEQEQQLAQISSSWIRFFLPKQEQSKNHWVPNLSTIIKAGDEGLFSSTLFHDLPEHSGELPIEALYDAFANELRSRPFTERSSYPSDMTKFLARMKKPASPRRSKSVPHNRSSTKRQRKSINVSAMEMGLARGLSVKKPAAVLTPLRNGLRAEPEVKVDRSWMNEGQIAKYRNGKMNIKVTPAELTALSIILGSQGTTNQDTPTNTSAYGISLHFSPTEGAITLRHHPLSISQRHPPGTSISPLYAKHLAAGSLPYLSDKLGLHSLLITTETFEAIKAGTPLTPHPYLARTRESQALESWPSAQEPRFHILAPSTTPHAPPTLLAAIASLPFSGGLVPIASRPLVTSIRFIASAGLAPGRLLQRLEALVAKIHRHAPHLQLFGPLYADKNAPALFRERTKRVGRLGSEDPHVSELLVDKFARVARYVTVLRRLMGLLPLGNVVVDAVQDAVGLELGNSYSAAVAADAELPCVETQVQVQIEHSASVAHRCTTPSPTKSSKLSADTSSSATAFTLAKEVERVLKMDLPFDVKTVALVARMVLVAWTLSVDCVG
ncbi:hypothetical protein BDW02DRAFT_588320 [Decorospora gaudefroyi]|uniref:Uncharacterized protein n=1 Tax=Decorospora gaudefroyi TaxID=184978 RepID=A0A6A5KBF8_9PLEO|nr:hypothetical protein BDW02DRAFT_588320 [Decorospora gaudefroyi]